MKIHGRSQTEEGSVILVAIMVCSILAITLVSYLNLASNQNMSTFRSLAWNSAIPVLEAGVEEALAHLYQKGTDPSDWGQEGWALGNGSYKKTRFVGEDYYLVGISNVVPPVIYSEAFVKVPISTNYVSRKVRVELAGERMFTKGMVAKGEIDLHGNNVRTDSFDSSDSNYSTDGLYDPAKAKDNGDVATNSGVVNSLNVGNADIHGSVSTGPGGSISIGPGGTVGSHAWHSGGNSGIEPGYCSDDMNVAFPDINPPYTGGYFWPSGGTADGVSYTYILDSKNYFLYNLKMSGSKAMLI